MNVSLGAIDDGEMRDIVDVLQTTEKPSYHYNQYQEHRGTEISGVKADDIADVAIPSNPAARHSKKTPRRGGEGNSGRLSGIMEHPRRSKRLEGRHSMLNHSQTQYHLGEDELNNAYSQHDNESNNN